MSKIHFIKSPFPDNHDGFDYEPTSFSDVVAEVDADKKISQQNKFLSILTSIFK